jgi:phosphatidylserine/phosphatidylglycerophosphate/cardiolipin synthase-like enzyme
MRRFMKRCIPLFVALTIVFWVVLSSCATVPAENTSPLNWEVYFSPNGGCTDAIARELDKAQSTVLVQAYSFTSYKIAKGLLDAHKRGVKVEIILDKSQKSDQYSSADFLANSGMSVKIDSEHAIAHNKVMVINGVTVITGSFNFTKPAEENNAENLLMIHDKKLAERYTKN